MIVEEVGPGLDRRQRFERDLTRPESVAVPFILVKLTAMRRFDVDRRGGVIAHEGVTRGGGRSQWPVEAFAEVEEE